MSEAREREPDKCIRCKAVCSEREGRVCDTCYTPEFVQTILDGDDE